MCVCVCEPACLCAQVDQKLKELEAAKDAARLFLEEYDDKHAALLGFPPPTRVRQAEDMEVELQSIKAARVSWGGEDAFASPCNNSLQPAWGLAQRALSF